MSDDIAQSWSTFALVIGAGAGALVGLLFVAISIRATTVAASAELRNRAAQTLVIFATLLLIAVLLSIPAQTDRLLGAELLLLATLLIALLVLLDRRARKSGELRLARVLKIVSPNTVTALGTSAAGTLLICGIDWGISLLVPLACFAIVGGLTSAWAFLTMAEGS
jgi:uncharacterized membrane protein